MTGFTTAALRQGLSRLADKLEASAEELNAADAKLGDGDLGVTLQRGARGLRAAGEGLPEDVGLALMKCAQAFVKDSGSSFGTLVATGLMSAAKACKGRDEVPWGEVSGLLAGALAAMTQRGRGALGEKTVLDSLEAARAATDGLEDPSALLMAADEAAGQALRAFHEQPARQGRARMFGEKSVGLDDPGMLAFKRMIEGLSGN